MKRYQTVLFLIMALCFSACAKPADTPAESDPADAAAPAETAQTEELTPVPAEDRMADLSALCGTWHTESQLSELTVYESGGFELRQGTECFEGTLAEEEPGSFAFYLEDGSRWGTDALLMIDASHPDALTLTQGLGAELYYPGARIIEEEAAPFTITKLEEVPNVGRVYNLAHTESPEIFTVRAEQKLDEFRILGLTVREIDEDGNPEFVTEELFFQETMIPSEEITFQVDVYGSMPNTGISYDDEDGNSHRWYLTVSGYDGSIIASPCDILPPPTLTLRGGGFPVKNTSVFR